MQIRLVPPSPHLPILFTLAFQPPAFDCPQTWMNQLQMLRADDLMLPGDFYSLDKAVWAVAMLEQVVFRFHQRGNGVVTTLVSCTFVDGSMEEFEVREKRCLEVLESVVRDVGDSHADAPLPVQQQQQQPIKKHKKQRSLLQAIVGYLTHDRASSSASGSALVAPAPPPPTPRSSFQYHPQPPASPERARFLRKRARATLVDAYRRFVLYELGRRMLPGGYYSWIARSTFRRAQRLMIQLEEGTMMDIPDLVRGDDERLSTTTVETDESSLIHTPQESMSNLPRSPSPPVSLSDVVKYNTLHGLCVRMRALLMRADAAERNAEIEREAVLCQLEVRSRRRAWLSCSLVGGASLKDCGLGVPWRSSPLVRFDPVSCDDEAEQTESYLKVASAPYDVSSLFPEESDTLFPVDVGGIEDDMEAGLLHDPLSKSLSQPVGLEAGSPYGLEHPHIRVRRTSRTNPRMRPVDDLCARGALDVIVDDPDVIVVPPPVPPHPSCQTGALIDSMRVLDINSGPEMHQGSPIPPPHNPSLRVLEPDSPDIDEHEFTLALDVKPFHRSMRQQPFHCHAQTPLIVTSPPPPPRPASATLHGPKRLTLPMCAGVTSMAEVV